MQRSELSYYEITQVLLSSLERKPESVTADIFSIYENASAFEQKKAPWCGGDQEYVIVGSTFLCELMKKKHAWLKLDDFVQSLMIKMIANADSECIDWRAVFCYLNEYPREIVEFTQTLNGRGLLDGFFYEALSKSEITLLENEVINSNVFCSNIVSGNMSEEKNDAILASLVKQTKIRALIDGLVKLRKDLDQLQDEKIAPNFLSLFKKNNQEESVSIKAMIDTIDGTLPSITYNVGQEIFAYLNQFFHSQSQDEIKKMIDNSGVQLLLESISVPSAPAPSHMG